MKKNSIRFVLSLFLLFFTFPVMAENYNSDIYEDDSSSNTANYPKKENYSYKKTDKKSKNNSNFSASVLSEFYSSNLTSSKQKIKEGESGTNSYFSFESLMRLKLSKSFFAETKWFLRPVSNRVYSREKYAGNSTYTVGDSYNSDFYGKEDYIRRQFQYDNYGLGVETLSLGYRNKNLAFGFGKINPKFGFAFDKSRFTGVYGVSIPEEYELTEKNGGYIAALLPFGNVTFSSFFDDTTGLSSTMFKSRGRDKSEGGAGNTDKLNNFAISLDSKMDNLSFNVGFRYLDVDLPNEKPEKGFVTGMEYLFELPYEVNFLPLFEVAYFNNYDGMASRDVPYFTAFMPFVFENWHFIFSNTTKFDCEKGYHTYSSYLTQLSVGYKFDSGLMVDFARIWERYAKKADDFDEIGLKNKWVRHSDSWTLMVSYIYSF